MAKPGVRWHNLAFVLIISLIFLFAIYIDTGEFFTYLAVVILGWLLAYKLLLPLANKLMDTLYALQEKLLEKLKKWR